LTRRYRNAPIAEAVCELRLDASVPWDSATPGLLWDPLRASYPRRSEDLVIEARLDAEAGAVKQMVTPMQVLRAASSSGDAVVSISARRLGISRLKPYPGWAAFRADIVNVLETADAVVGEAAVPRVGLRYLNRLQLPETNGLVQLQELLTFYPETSSAEQGLPATGFSQFLLQVVFPCDDDLSVLRLQLSPASQGEASPPGTAAFMLDIDHFSDQRRHLTTKTVMSWLEEAHERVERVFESCLRDATREMLGPVNE